MAGVIEQNAIVSLPSVGVEVSVQIRPQRLKKRRDPVQMVREHDILKNITTALGKARRLDK